MMHSKLRKLVVATNGILLGCALLLGTAFAVPVVDVTKDESTQQPLLTDSSSSTPAAVDTASMTIDQRVARLEQIVAAQGQMQLLDRINQLQQNVEILQGQNEILRHQLQQLQDQQRKYYQDLDQRVTALEGGKKATAVMPVAVGTVPAGTGDDQTAYQNAYNLLSKQQYDQALDALNSKNVNLSADLMGDEGKQSMEGLIGRGQGQPNQMSNFVSSAVRFGLNAGGYSSRSAANPTGLTATGTPTTAGGPGTMPPLTASDVRNATVCDSGSWVNGVDPALMDDLSHQLSGGSNAGTSGEAADLS